MCPLGGAGISWPGCEQHRAVENFFKYAGRPLCPAHVRLAGFQNGNPLYLADETVQLSMTGDSQEWFRQARYDLGTAESLLGSERYPPVLFFCHPALEKALKGLYIEKYNDIPEKTHSLVLLVELLELQLPQHLVDSLLVINRLGVTGRYPHNLEKMLEQYTRVQTRKILDETQEILTWLIQKSLKR